MRASVRYVDNAHRFITQVYIKDLGSSSNGTFLNKIKVDAPVVVKSGATLVSVCQHRRSIKLMLSALEREVTEFKAVVVRVSIAGSAVTLTPTTNSLPTKALDVSEPKVLGGEHGGLVPRKMFFKTQVC